MANRKSPSMYKNIDTYNRVFERTKGRLHRVLMEEFEAKKKIITDGETAAAWTWGALDGIVEVLAIQAAIMICKFSHRNFYDGTVHSTEMSERFRRHLFRSLASIMDEEVAKAGLEPLIWPWTNEEADGSQGAS